MPSVAPFTPGGTVNLSASTSTARAAVNLPAGQNLVVTNLGPDLAYIAVGDVTVTATTSGFPILPGTQLTLSLPISTTYIAAICPSSTATIKLSSGDGIIGGVGASTSGSSGGVTSTVKVVDQNGNPVTYNPNGLATRANSSPVVIADFNSGEYETVAASQTAQVLGATGATGDYLSGLLIIPATTSPGQVLLLDNATSITIFTGGASSVSTLIPFFVALGTYSVSGAWKVTTGTNVSVIGIGNFT